MNFMSNLRGLLLLDRSYCLAKISQAVIFSTQRSGGYISTVSVPIASTVGTSLIALYGVPRFTRARPSTMKIQNTKRVEERRGISN
jgi:hypothetical protein